MINGDKRIRYIDLGRKKVISHPACSPIGPSSVCELASLQILIAHPLRTKDTGKASLRIQESPHIISSEWFSHLRGMPYACKGMFHVKKHNLGYMGPRPPPPPHHDLDFLCDFVISGFHWFLDLLLCRCVVHCSEEEAFNTLNYNAVIQKVRSGPHLGSREGGEVWKIPKFQNSPKPTSPSHPQCRGAFPPHTQLGAPNPFSDMLCFNMAYCRAPLMSGGHRSGLDVRCGL